MTERHVGARWMFSSARVMRGGAVIQSVRTSWIKPKAARSVPGNAVETAVTCTAVLETPHECVPVAYPTLTALPAPLTIWNADHRRRRPRTFGSVHVGE